MSHLVPVSMDADLVEAATRAGAGSSRNASEQISHWARIGRRLEALPGSSLRDYFRSLAPPAELTHDDGRWVASIPGTPFVSEGTTIDGALEDLIDSLREYAEDWEERLQHAPNHQSNFVQLVKLSSDAELREWLGAQAASPMRLSIEAMAWRNRSLRADALKASEVARLLNIGLGRVRQRAAQRTLFVMPSTDRRLWFPLFQFTDDGELPGWAALCRELPEQADPAAVEYFLTRPHPDLAGGELTPGQWLAAGKPAEDVVVLAEQVFGTR